MAEEFDEIGPAGDGQAEVRRPSAADGPADVRRALAAVDLLAPSFVTSGLDELEVEAGDLHVRLARPVTPIRDPAPPGAAPASQPGRMVTPFGEPAPGMRFVSAPLTGVWYAAPSPGAQPYLQAGGEVSAGQVVGLIEAMKLFNEIKSDVTGTVTRVLVESGTLVKRQQPLLEVAQGTR
ncbi:MAG: acetyl-CoA carboxylase biotin carboxyl carrier protein [Chloroflexota bacterium]|nr:acetyl-CoA carboxylase biotin carboxyl carrier protein [Chloroflexota bacterium]